MTAKICCNDNVVLLRGKDKGKKGKVKSILSSGKVIIEGINLVKKHQKPIPSLNHPGGIVKKESSIPISNVAVINVTTGKADRIGFKIKDGKKVRFFKSNGEIVN